jgi:uncharacterized protein (TIGR02145 family)
MKNLYVIILTVFFTASMFAQPPQKMSYQAVIRNNINVLVTSSPVGMRISILQGSSNGSAVYVETQNATTNANGLVSIEIGGGTVISGTFAGIDWSAGTYFIKTETDPTGVANYTITGTSQLLSVPYSLYAKNAESVDDMMDQLYDQGYLKPKDGDGNLYNVIKIGNQRWLKENLKTTKYNDGTAILNVTDNTTWISLGTGAYCDYANNSANSVTYGRLYNWYAVTSTNPKNVCPKGWKVPTDSEWTTLTTYLGGESVAGGKIKETGTTHWNSPNTGATNETGFTALPGGNRGGLGTFANMGGLGFWWSDTEYNSTNSMSRYLNFDYAGITRNGFGKNQGFSVRCLR